jgi:dienelactone hydrolase
VELGEKLKNSRFPPTVIVYPDAYHGFDNPGDKVVTLPNVYNPRAPNQRGARAGGHPPSRLKAIEDLDRFVDQQLARHYTSSSSGIGTRPRSSKL